MSSLLVLGLSHRHFPIDVLERVSIGPDDLDKALRELTDKPNLTEVIVLSTCNRTEVYAIAERFHPAYSEIRDFLGERADLGPGPVGELVHSFHDDEAIRHLFEVASGLKSAVLGEHEILGQVKRAWSAAQAHGSVGPRLNELFRASVEAGKRVRTDTAISHHIASVSQAAIALADEAAAGLEHRHMLLIGAGEMGAGVAMTLADRELASLSVMSRSTETAAAVAERSRAQPVAFDGLVQALVRADVVISSTAATEPVVTTEIVRAAVAQRTVQSPLLIVDIALPRDVDPAVASLDGVTLLDLDAVNSFVARGLADRAAERQAADAIVNEETTRFLRAASAREVGPLVADFRTRSNDVVRAELARRSAELDGLSTAQHEAVEAVVNASIAKLLHTPTIRLKDSAATPRGERLASALRELFDLD